MSIIDGNPIVEVTDYNVDTYNVELGWYFYDEDWVELMGPYQTEDDCLWELNEYAERSNNIKDI